MQILIVAATSFEMYETQQFVSENLNELAEKGYFFDFLVTGVGMVHTTYALSQYFHNHSVDVAIQIGVAGSFRMRTPIGSVVKVVSEAFGDMGAEDGAERLDLFEMNLWEPHEAPFENKLLFAPESFPLPIGKELQAVHGITVNMVSGVAASIALRKKKFAADIESMEGAAFHFVCLQQGIPFQQIRAISNYVEPRDTSNWKMKNAITALNAYLIQSLDAL